MDNHAPAMAASDDRLAVTARDDHRNLDHRPDCFAAGRWIATVDDAATVLSPSPAPFQTVRSQALQRRYG